MNAEETQLHDRFAECAMHSQLRSYGGMIGPVGADGIARSSYTVADAMIAERRARAIKRSETAEK